MLREDGGGDVGETQTQRDMKRVWRRRRRRRVRDEPGRDVPDVREALAEGQRRRRRGDRGRRRERGSAGAVAVVEHSGPV
jgi:hypothetical protein